jgi:hypothetical protein
MLATDAVTSALIAGIVALVVAAIGGTVSVLTNRRTLKEQRKSNDEKLEHEREAVRQTLREQRKSTDEKLEHEREALRQTLEQERKLNDARLDYEREKLRELTRTQFMAEEAIRDLLKCEEFPLRTFETIRNRVGGFDGNDGDDLRQLLIRSGAVRFRSKSSPKKELWGLVSRNRDLIKSRAEKDQPREEDLE